VLVFVFYLFIQPPIFHNATLKNQAMETAQADSIRSLEGKYNTLYAEKRKAVDQLVEGIQSDNQALKESSKQKYTALKAEEDQLRKAVKATIAEAVPAAKTQDRDYIFLNFVLSYLPHGIIGLLLAVMFSAAMSSMASELNALASTTTVDIYRRSIHANASDEHYVKASRYFTVLWALIAMAFAALANFAENLIQFVNIVGSLFYGTILGIFLVAFYLKHVKSNAVFIAALIAESLVLCCYFYFYDQIAFLFYNIIGCVIVVVVALLIQQFSPSDIKKAEG
ncbi:MAG: sodium:solute symporter family transporter, partial [Cyclobacteriaceae bacterium]